MFASRKTLFLFVFTFAICAFDKANASDGDELQPCIDLLSAENGDECCESFKIFKAMDEIMNLCTSKDPIEFDCEDYKCVLNKLGLLRDSNIDETEVKRYFNGLANDYPEQARLIDYIEDNCLYGKYNNYDFLDENCPAMNFYTCSYINLLLKCDSWKTSDDCKTIGQDAQSCKSVMDKNE